jgi:hypothetical protein
MRAQSACGVANRNRKAPLPPARRVLRCDCGAHGREQEVHHLADPEEIIGAGGFFGSRSPQSIRGCRQAEPRPDREVQKGRGSAAKERRLARASGAQVGNVPSARAFWAHGFMQRSNVQAVLQNIKAPERFRGKTRVRGSVSVDCQQLS